MADVAPVIDARALRFSYPGGGFRLSVDAFSAQPGETVALIGPSGCGKSTFLNLLAGVLRPDAGNVTLDGTPLSPLAEKARRRLRARAVGFVFQDFGLLDHLSARDNILHPFRLSGALRLTGDVRDRLEALAARLGIAALLDCRPQRLSYGERQRVAICRALLSRPRLVLADEPTGALDPATKRAIVDLLVEAARLEGTALVTVTHDHALLPAFDRVEDFAKLAVVQ